ncbi:MAG TPA: hypothetical protein DCG49_05490 [Ruminococcus sp.]|nr:hypothetical protein [Ruminococcus sp.]
MQRNEHVRSVLPMQTAKTGYIIISLLLCAAGIFLAVHPETGVAAVGSIAGGILIVFGVIKLIGYFSKDLYRLAFQFDFAAGLLLIVLGTVILTKPANLLHFLCVVTGLYVTTDGLLKLQTAQEAKRFGLRSWGLILAAALLTAAVGVVLLVHPSESTVLLLQIFGAVLLAEGALNLITVLMTVKIIRHQIPDVMETKVREGD